MRAFPKGRNSKPRKSKVATMVEMLEGTLMMSSSPKVNNILSRVEEVVFEVVIKVKAGVRISPGTHFDRYPPSLIPDICDLPLNCAPAKELLEQADVHIYDFMIMEILVKIVSTSKSESDQIGFHLFTICWPYPFLHTVFSSESKS